MIKFLIDRGASVHGVKSTPPLIHAIREIDIPSDLDEIVRYLLKNGADVNQYYGIYTPLMIAIGLNNESMVQLLLTHGANPNFNINTISPIYKAAQVVNQNILEMLVRHGGSVNKLNLFVLPNDKNIFYSALELAEQIGELNAVKILIDAGAIFTDEIDLITKEVRIGALSMAKLKGHNEVVALMEYRLLISLSNEVMSDNPVNVDDTPKKIKIRL